MHARREPSLSVVKIGGSVLTGPPAFRRAAAFLAGLLSDDPGRQFIVVVSAEYGLTDALLSSARDIVPEPDPEVLDLLWSTGEIRSVALLVLALHAQGVRAAALNVHQAGVIGPDSSHGSEHIAVKPLRLRAALAEADVVVVPGFLARSAADAIVSLGRGGSDLTAVLLAAGLGARTCQLVKDVAGYFSRDPNIHADATPLDHVSFERAIAMARDDGCELVQPAALEAARDSKVTLHVRALDSKHGTFVY